VNDGEYQIVAVLKKISTQLETLSKMVGVLLPKCDRIVRYDRFFDTEIRCELKSGHEGECKESEA